MFPRKYRALPACTRQSQRTPQSVLAERLGRRASSSAAAAGRPSVPSPRDFKYFCAFQTRWKDNDVYSHLNNIEYNAYFDSIVNQYMRKSNSRSFSRSSSTKLMPKISRRLTVHHVGTQLPHPAGLRRMTTPLGLAISSTTTFTASLSYPNPVIGALAVDQLGNSSVTWKVGLFAAEYKGGIVPGDGGFFVRDRNRQTNETDRSIDSDKQDIVLEPKIVLRGGFRQAKAAAFGTFKHVFTDPETQKSVKIPQDWRQAFERILIDGQID
ncbi:hypothetical protein OIV83_002047 [Microbotryomycetes sp. JL201]|nr:hypothetical protein OIV83_002047 [Microbotryomycetes sp. JL201]